MKNQSSWGSSRVARGAIVAAVLGLGPRAQADLQVDVVDQLRIDKYNPTSPSSSFTFSGTTGYPGKEGKVSIWVAKRGNDDNPESDPIDVAKWVWVKDVYPSNTRNSQGLYSWSSGSIAAFKNGAGEDRWPQGGTARVRVLGYPENSIGRNKLTDAIPLMVRDGNGQLAYEYTLVLSDTTPDPTVGATKPNYLSKQRIDFPTVAAQTLETIAYYKAAKIDPTGTRTIDNSLTNLAAFRTRYFPSASSPACKNESGDNLFVETTATYYNRGDLGLGREMHCAYNPCAMGNLGDGQEVACYVKNFGSVSNGVPKIEFGNKAASQTAAQQGKHFATVAMVSRDWVSEGDPNQVIFMAYDAKDALVRGPVPLDNRALNNDAKSNSFLPGNCITCHGGKATYDQASHSVAGAYFLPFDLQAFDYFTYSPSLSRANQEAKFKALNETVLYDTPLGNLAGARETVEQWYNLGQSPTFINDVVPRTTDPTKIPWNVAEKLYKTVYAPYCRTCHISMPDDEQGTSLRTYTDFLAQGENVYDDMCGDGKTMPQAEQTMKQMWNSSARSQLLSHFQVSKGCGNQVKNPP